MRCSSCSRSALLGAKVCQWCLVAPGWLPICQVTGCTATPLPDIQAQGRDLYWILCATHQKERQRSGALTAAQFFASRG